MYLDPEEHLISATDISSKFELLDNAMKFLPSKFSEICNHTKVFIPILIFRYSNNSQPLKSEVGFNPSDTFSE